jgi:multiple sugar transport system substrate-binding protein
MRLRRRLAATAAVLAGVVSLAACGGAAPEPASSTCEPSQGDVTLSFWSWVPGMDEAVKMWNAENPNIRVTLNTVAGGNQGTYQNLFNALKAGTEPDLAQIEYDMLPSFRLQQGLRDISQCLEEFQGDQFIDFAWEQVTFQERGVYAVPQDTGPMAMFYRKDLFDKYGVEVPRTWEEFRAVAEQVHEQDPSVQITHFPQRDTGWFAALAWQHGARWFGIDGDAWVVSMNDRPTDEVASYWQDLLARDLVAPIPGFSTEWFNALAGGKLLTWVAPVWGSAIISSNVPTTAGQWAVAPMPYWEAGVPSAANWGGSTTAVLRGSDHPYEAAQFALWLNTDPESLELLNKNGGLYPATKAGLDLPFLQQPVEFYDGQPIFDVFAQAARHVDPDFVWGPTMTQTYTALADGFGKALGGEWTLSDALDAAEEETVTAMRLQALEAQVR